MRVRVGSDIVCIDRFRSVLQKRGLGFLSRFLNIDEVSYAVAPNKLVVVRDCVEAGTGLAGALSSLDLSDVKLPRVCGFWAAKEAFVKALGCGIGSSVGFSDIEIFKDDAGCPFVRFPKEADFNVSGTSISISHDGNFAICNCIIVYDD